MLVSDPNIDIGASEVYQIVLPVLGSNMDKNLLMYFQVIEGTVHEKM